MLCTHSEAQPQKEREMNSSSKVIVAATMVMVVSLVMVLSLVLVLLAELYCSLLLNRRRRQPLTLPTTVATSLAQAISTTNHTSPSPSSLPNTGVLQTEAASIDDFIYISNPIYSKEATTPFQTPYSSPSRLEEDHDIMEDSTPTLTPMKDLPQKACSVSLKEVRSLETSASESNNDPASSSSSASPYTSPSW